MNVTAKLEGSGAAAAARRARLAEARGTVPEPWRGRAARGRPRPECQRRRPELHGRSADDRRGRPSSATRAPTTGCPRSQFQRYKRQIERDARQRQEPGATASTSRSSASTRATGSRTPRTRAREEVGGAETIHVSAGRRRGCLLNDLDDLLGRAASLGVAEPAAARANSPRRQKPQIEKAIQDVRFDLWTGEEDKILRRLEVEFGFDAPQGRCSRTPRASSAAPSSMALEIADVNKEQEIKRAQRRAAAVGAAEHARGRSVSVAPRRRQRLLRRAARRGRLVRRWLVRQQRLVRRRVAAPGPTSARAAASSNIDPQALRSATSTV